MGTRRRHRRHTRKRYRGGEPFIHVLENNPNESKEDRAKRYKAWFLNRQKEAVAEAPSQEVEREKNAKKEANAKVISELRD